MHPNILDDKLSFVLADIRLLVPCMRGGLVVVEVPKVLEDRQLMKEPIKSLWQSGGWRRKTGSLWPLLAVYH